MKKTILFIIIIILCVGHSVKAQDDYIPFVVEGKVWNFARQNFAGPYWYGKYFLNGDTVINDISCKRMYVYNFNNDDKVYYKAALYEKNRKVYCIMGKQDKEQALYDFSGKAGDIVKSYYDEKYNEYTLKLEVIGIEEKCLSLDRTQKYYVIRDVAKVVELESEETKTGFWIEGVGSNKDPFDWYPAMVLGDNTSLVSCIVKGDTLYSEEEYFKFEQALSKKYITSISQVKANTNAKEAGCYDLHGRKIAQPVKGLNIIRYKDGTTRKVMK